MIRLWAATVSITLAGPLAAEPAAADPRAEGPADFFAALGLPPRGNPDVWGTPDDPGASGGDWASEDFSVLTRPSFLLDHLSGPGAHAAWTVDPGRWRYQQETAGGLYRRKTKLELPDPQEVWSPYGVHNWKAQDKVHIPVPVPVPLAEQLFVYGQFDGSGDTLRQEQTALQGKTGVGVKWSLLAGSELQLRYATLLSYADEVSLGRAQPAVEVSARVPLIGPLEIEYSGSARPAVTTRDTDQFRQELRFAYPLRGDSELEFGARYRWEYTPTPSPWVDRAQLFLGVKLRH